MLHLIFNKLISQFLRKFTMELKTMKRKQTLWILWPGKFAHITSGLHIHWQELTRRLGYHSNRDMQVAQIMIHTLMQWAIRMHTGWSGWKHVWVSMHAKVQQSKPLVCDSLHKHPITDGCSGRIHKKCQPAHPWKTLPCSFKYSIWIRFSRHTGTYLAARACTRARTHRYIKWMAKGHKAIWNCIRDKTLKCKAYWSVHSSIFLSMSNLHCFYWSLCCERMAIQAQKWNLGIPLIGSLLS